MPPEEFEPAIPASERPYPRLRPLGDWDRQNETVISEYACCLCVVYRNTQHKFKHHKLINNVWLNPMFIFRDMWNAKLSLPVSRKSLWNAFFSSFCQSNAVCRVTSTSLLWEWTTQSGNSKRRKLAWCVWEFTVHRFRQKAAYHV